MLDESVMRRKDLQKCYDKIVKQCKKQGGKSTSATIIEQTINSEAPGYYITYDYALRLLRQYRRRKLPRNYSTLKRDMITEIARKVNKLMESQQGYTEGEALAMVLAGGNASRFFISPISARRIIKNNNLHTT